MQISPEWEHFFFPFRVHLNSIYPSFWCCKRSVSLEFMSASVAEFYLFVFEGSKAIDCELFKVSVCLLSGKFYNALNYITLILNWLGLEVVSVPKGTAILVLIIPVKIRLLFHLLQLGRLWDSYCNSPKITTCGILKTSCAFPWHYREGQQQQLCDTNVICLRCKCDL